MKNGKHLDLGCGGRPRNPYEFSHLSGIDIYQHPNSAPEVTFKLANLSINPIPFEDNTFDSVSAYDFIEHIPRVLAGGTHGTRFPFVELMNEVWRVLKPNGMFYAITPAYPRLEAFKDPTHVNIITAGTHEYFCDETCYAKSYGFIGKFEATQVAWAHPRLLPKATEQESFKLKLKNIFRSYIRRKEKSHLIWQLKAVK